jgi:hypothetical protein
MIWRKSKQAVGSYVKVYMLPKRSLMFPKVYPVLGQLTMDSYKNSTVRFAMHVCPSVVPEWQTDSWQTDFHEIVRLTVLLKFARSVQFCLK